jgi:hypothetical protein
MEFELHIDKVDPDYRWNRMQELGTDNLARFISYRDDATLAWFTIASGNGGIRLVPAVGSTITEPEHFRRVNESPVVEIRQYRIAPGQRARFAEFFRLRSLPPLIDFGMAVYGAFDDLDDANNFVWMRGFPDLAERDRRKAAFYQSKLWLEELQDEAFSMIEDYSNVLLAMPV